jgi:hypothetical protein
MQDETRQQPKMAAAAERHMKAWALSGEMEDRQSRSRALEQLSRGAHPYIAMSRQAGAGGGEIAHLVGERLGIDVYDKELLDLMGERYNVDPMMLKLVDETQSNWVYEVLGTWMDRSVIPHQRYVSMVSRVVLALAHCGSMVVVGRGAQFLLPRDKGLAVRIIAPEKLRLERFARQHDLDLEDARPRMVEVDQGRHEFVERFFHRDSSDAHLYDLVVNTERIALRDAAEQIATAFLRCFPPPAAGAPHFPQLGGILGSPGRDVGTSGAKPHIP